MKTSPSLIQEISTEPGLSRTTPVLSPAPSSEITPTPPTEPSQVTGPRFLADALVAERYRIRRLLGRGGMGEVYQAEDVVLGELVALKFLPESLESHAEHRAHLYDEVRLARQVTHPNICRVHDVGESAGTLFLTMEWIDGETLTEFLRREGPPPPARAADIAHQLCRGLAAAHERGILHRDLKPANVMLDRDGTVRITDFGLAVVAETLTDDEFGRGTPAYMAPEVFRGGPATVRSDLYSLGAVLYKLLAGRPVFDADSMSELARFVFEARPEPLSRWVADVDPDLERAILACLEKDPQKRPLSALEVAAGLPAAAVGESTQHTLLSIEVLGRARWPEEVGEAAARRLDTLDEIVLKGLLEKYGGRRSAGDGTPFVFERPIHAVRFALDYQLLLAELSEGTGESENLLLAMRGAVHLGEVVFIEREPEVARAAWEVAARLRALGSRHQLLMTRRAFDLARQTAAAELDGVRWLAHGSYEIDGLPEPLELFEAGREGTAPLRPPTDSPRARRRIVQETVGGWRPAPGLELPGRPGWRVESRLSEGGFGEVWTVGHPATGKRRVFKFCYDARRLRALQREITVFRLLKEELGERDDVARILDWSFEQAPYFIEVEHTEGGDLVQWAERQGGLGRVPLGTRLELAAQVATALAAAHSVGVLHKDVKPANVLVGGGPGGPPKARLSDFGLGLVTQPQRLDQAGITALGLTRDADLSAEVSSREGTRFYMAPEVLAGRRATLQSDIYALGVLLYQVVVGDFSRTLGPGWERDVPDELLREDIAAAADVLPERRLSAAQLAVRLGSLEQRRAERAERQRELEEGRKARATITRWRRRLRWTAVALAVMTVFVAVVWIQARRIAREAETTQQVTDFLLDIFKVSDPEIAMGEEISAREVLHRGAERIELELRGRPRIQASIMHTIGQVFYNLGAYDDAEELFTQALEIRRRLHGGSRAEIADSLTGLGKTLDARGEPGAAMETLQQAVDMYREIFGQESLEVARALEALAKALAALGQQNRAEASFSASYRIRRELLGEDHLEVAASLTSWSKLLNARHDYPRAEGFLQEALRIRETQLGDRHPDVAESLYRLGHMRYMQDKYELAGEALRRALRIHRESLGPDHLTTLRNLHSIGKLHHAMADAELSERLYREAEKDFQHVLERTEATQPGNHRWIAAVLFDMARLYESWGDLERSERYFLRGLEEHRRQESRTDPDPYEALFERFLAVVDHKQGRTGVAEPRLRAALAALEQAWSFNNIHTATTAVELADLLISKMEYAEAEKLIEEALAAYRALKGVELWRVLRARALLAACLYGSGQPEQAERIVASVRSQSTLLRGKKRLLVENALRTATTEQLNKAQQLSRGTW